jgi:hypothetical protein
VRWRKSGRHRHADSSPTAAGEERKKRQPTNKRIEGFSVARKKREEAAEKAVSTGGKGSPVRRKTQVMSTVQASDHDAALWDMRFAKAEMDGEIDTASVGNPYDDDPMGRKRSASRRYRRA